MQWNSVIHDQLQEWIENPAVLMTAEDAPVEMRPKNLTIHRFKRRRTVEDIPLQLYTFILENGISRNQLREFGSGLFLNYCETASIYT